VKGLKLSDIQLWTAASDLRHAVVFEDVEEAQINSLDVTCWPDACAVIQLTDVKGVFVRGCSPKAGTDLFLDMRGQQSERVLLMANDLSNVGRVAKLAPNVRKTALVLQANHLPDK